MSTKLSRKEFLKLAGLAAAAVPAAKCSSKIGGQEYVESPVQYGGFMVRELAPDDPPPYEVDEATFKRFNPYNVSEARRGLKGAESFDFFGDPQQIRVAGEKRDARLPGWDPFAAALNEGVNWLRFNRPANSYGWETEVQKGPSLLEGYSPEEITKRVKVAALFLGASLVGVAEVDERWFYNSLGGVDTARPLIFDDVEVPIRGEEGPIVIPKRMNRVIAMAHEMDYDAFLPNGITRISASAVGQGYSKMAFHTGSLAKFIRTLGYQAIPMGNDTALSVPIAIDAGLGEQCRIGFLMTPKYGPRVRLSKLLTDLPLIPDRPITFGVKEFCMNCELCADYCPSSCIDKTGAFARPTYERHGINNIVGVKKWQVDQTLCALYWREVGVGCSNCISVCPFNKPQSWLHDATRILIGAGSGSLDSLLAKLDQAVGYGRIGEEPDAEAVDYFWNKKEEYVHIKKG